MKKKIVVVLSLVLCLMLSISLAACNKNKHEAKSEWKFDNAQHWHECATKGHDDKLDVAAHVYDKEVVADEYRASEATYTEPAKYYKSCVCGAKGTETFNNGSTLSAQDNQVNLKSGVTLGKTYDGAAYSLSADKFTFGGNGAITFEYKSEGASDWSQIAPVNAGDYKVRVSVAATAEWKAAQATFDFAIAKKQLTISGTTVDDKYYDGTTKATIADGSLAVSGIIGEDDVTVTPTATFASSAPGNDVTVNVTFALSGVAAGNYCVEDTTVTANIIAKAKIVTARVYLKTKDEGGRHSPVAVNYKPSFLYGSGKSTNATLISFSGNEYDDLFMPGETVTATFLLENADYMFVGDTFTLKEATTEVATGTITSIDGIEVDMLYDKDKGYYTTGDVDFGKTVYANVTLSEGEWKVLMDTGVATYKVYDSNGDEITVNDGVFALGTSDTVTLVFTPVDGGGVDACAIQQKK